MKMKRRDPTKTTRDTRRHLVYFAIIALTCLRSAICQSRPLGVCDALNSAVDNQAVVIHAAIASTQHGNFLFEEGTSPEPCPGWPNHLFTAPPVIPLILGSYAGVDVSHDLFWKNVELLLRLRTLQKANPSLVHMVTVSGIVIRKRWPLIFRNRKGEYCCWGEGPDGSYAALLVVTSPLTEGH